MTRPNFFVVGAPKCGTDSLYSYLAQHPEIYMSPNKEPMFFVAEGQDTIPYRGPGDCESLKLHDCWVNSLEEYEALFGGATTEQAIGEASTWYLYHEQVPGRIRQYAPHARIIAILRNPVDRAYSAYNMIVHGGRETVDFARALAAEDRRVQANWEPTWHYRRMGFYAAQLARYNDIFDRSQIHVILYDDFVACPREVVRDLFTFLRVDDRFEPDVSERHNVSMAPKNMTYHTLISGQSALKSVIKATLPSGLRYRVKTRLLAPNFTRPAPVPLDVRLQLTETFRSDILQLQECIGRDLSDWLRPRQAENESPQVIGERQVGTRSSP